MAKLSIKNKMKTTLAQRAAFIALPKEEESQLEESPLLVFEIGKQKYGILFTVIDKVIHNQKITSVPGVHPLFSGIIYHNSEVWPVVNTCNLLDCKEGDGEVHFILIRSGAHRYGFLVGAIFGRLVYDKSEELTHLPSEKNQKQSYIQGIYQSEIALLDMNEIMNALNTLYH